MPKSPRRIGGKYVMSHGERTGPAWMYDERLPTMDNVTTVLAELNDERRRLAAELARVERVIGVIEELSGAEPRLMVAAPAPDVVATKAPPPSVPAVASLPYVTMNVYEAVAAHLAEVKEAQTSRQIADALVAGGYPTRSSYFCNALGTMLRRKDSTRQYRISVTPDGRHWFVRARRSTRESATPDEQT
jgi:hypothetical protein